MIHNYLFEEVAKTTVVNKQRSKFDVFIGRPSKWGNPFSHLNTSRAEYKVNTREEAIEAYRDWLLNGDGRFLLKDLHELKGKRLGCFCKPLACHGDVIAEYLNSL